VQATEFNFARFKHLLNSGHQRNPNPVAELNTIKAQIDNLTKHFVPRCMPMRIPAGGEGNHDRA
jgi:hypothetical protein